MSADLANTGLYFPDEISLMLNIDRQKVYRWIKHYWPHRIIKDNAINFYSFIEMYVFWELRSRGWTMQKINKVYNWLKQKLNTKYPFARFEFYMYGDELIIDYKGFVSVDKHPGQGKIKDFLTPFAEKIDFTGNLAKRFYPAGKEGWIVSDPQIRAGEPVIRGTRIDTWTIYNMLKAGETPETIAWAYQIPLESIEAVKNFHKLAV